MKDIFDANLRPQYPRRDPDVLDLLIALRREDLPAQFGDEMGQPLRTLAQVYRKGARIYVSLRFE